MRFGRKSHFAKIAKKLAKRSANSQRSASHPEATNFGRRAKPWERMRYLDKARKLARGQKRISLAMDATDISRKKYMNATACLPQLNVVMWLPPMDLGGFQASLVHGPRPGAQDSIKLKPKLQVAGLGAMTT